MSENRYSQKIDALDMVIEVLREHEKALDEIADNLRDQESKMKLLIAKMEKVINARD